MIRAIGLFLALLHAPLSAAEFPAFLESYCLECHDDLAKKGGLDLSRFLTEDDVMADREVWAAVHEKIESHQMPPPKEYAQPTDADRTALLAWIEDIAARPDPALEARDPGKPVLRRLTRLEYNNAIRDLFGLEMDIFAFPERLPLRDKSYFQPATGVMPAEIRVEMREYGAKYPVLCPQLGLPGDHRAEHGYRNRGDTQDFSPLLLENYLAAALTIVNAPELPRRSRVFADLLGLEESSLGFSPKAEDGELGRKPKLLTSFAPDIETIPDAGGNAIPLADFRRRLAEAHAQGLGGVFDVPKSVANQTIEGKGGLIRAAFGNRSLTINPNADLWIAAFATAKATSAPAILTNKEKGAKVFELTFDIESDDAEEGVEHLGFCLVGRRGQSGTVKLTAIFTDATEQTISRDMAEGEAGTTFVSFSAPPGEAVKKLVVDGSGFSGDYVLLDDLAVIQSSLGFSPNLPRPELGLKPKLLSASPVERLNAFADRAFRRPLSDEERATFRTLFHQVQAAGASEADAMRQAVAAVLASPALLYVEANGTPGDAPVTPLEDHELATRLALFLWASTPDEELLALAREGRLHDPAVLEAQTRRMLKDPRSRELSESFAVQWLRLDQLQSAKPDPELFKSFYYGPQNKGTLHGSALAEALLLFETVQIEDRPILDFLAADYTWLNSQLSRLYGIPLAGSEDITDAPAGTNRELRVKNDRAAIWRRVTLDDANRGGFATMSAPLIVTSLPFRTSPVKRGAWILETLFNRPPTEPKVAFAIENDTKEAAQQMSIREKFELHRNQAACQSCHIRLDPPGFALERFDPVGQWTPDADAKGEWSGRAFDGPAGFKAILAENPHEFTRGFIEHLLSYAITRKLGIHDMPEVARIQQAAEADGWKFSRVVVEIAKSYPFTHVRR
ncbi:MAG: DUF1592 domain-containing protein [Verrucomicrobiales bacterium]|nr:DUF1592 domain-containing protein [Verrucomicrobiales bacterium]